VSGDQGVEVVGKNISDGADLALPEPFPPVAVTEEGGVLQRSGSLQHNYHLRTIEGQRDQPDIV
jgi:hypothetical protein